MPLKILAVDDNKPSRHLIRGYLEQEGCEVTEADNGDIAISRLREDRFDGVFLDILMPVRDGFEVLAWIRDNQPGLPVVVFTEAGSIYPISFPEMAEQFGALKSFNKPVTRALVREGLDLIAGESD